MQENDIDKILAELKAILLRKQEDYGPLNISLSPGGPYNGLRVRMFDKLQRFSHLYEQKNDTPNYESLRDTFIDLANYAIIGILVQNGQWEGISNGKSHSPIRPTDPLSRPKIFDKDKNLYKQLQTDPTVVRRG